MLSQGQQQQQQQEEEPTPHVQRHEGKALSREGTSRVCFISSFTTCFT
jgi:hypothetical protein